MKKKIRKQNCIRDFFFKALKEWRPNNDCHLSGEIVGYFPLFSPLWTFYTLNNEPLFCNQKKYTLRMFEVISMCSQCKLGKSASLQRLVQWSHPQALKFLVMRLFPWIQGHLCDLGWVKWSFSWNPEVSPIAINMLAKMGKPDFPLLGKSLLQEERMNQHRTRTEKWGEQDLTVLSVPEANLNLVLLLYLFPFLS